MADDPGANGTKGGQKDDQLRDSHGRDRGSPCRHGDDSYSLTGRRLAPCPVPPRAATSRSSSGSRARAAQAADQSGDATKARTYYAKLLELRGSGGSPRSEAAEARSRLK